ncbi:GAF and ANTAR domain-containing protein [Streptomyces sp. NPDC051133]|uniref:GAF and ANTAR domain-containing protein n=1 Tax=Streptomyces sp. NPDC051133 TaxID=3155521 RepID=UPI00343B1D5D
MTEDDSPSDGDLDMSAKEQRRVVSVLAEALREVSPEDAPLTLCRACLRLLPITGVSLSVRGPGAGQEALLCATDDVAAQLAELQYTLGEGPCLQAGEFRAPVFASDLRDSGAARRWPMFAALAVRAGARAVYCVPLGGPASPLGTLDMYRGEAGPLSAEDIRVALVTADAVTAALVALNGNAQDTEEVVAWLRGAESDREEVHQAAGMMMVRWGVGPDEALARLRARAFAEGRTASEVARDIVNRTSDITGQE